HAPYEILQTQHIDFATMQKLRRFARYWDLVGNSGNFVETTPLIWGKAAGARTFLSAATLERLTLSTCSEVPAHSDAAADRNVRAPAQQHEGVSPFRAFMGWSEWLHGRVGRADSIALVRLMELLFEF